MGECIRQLCTLSVLFGAALSICPEGGAKRVLAVVCTAALTVAALTPLVQADLTVYALELARSRERESSLTESAGAMNDRLNRLVIQGECEAYIMDKATELGLELQRCQVEAEWNSEGLWVPCGVKISWRGEETARQRLAGLIETELGVGPERQQWSRDE